MNLQCDYYAYLVISSAEMTNLHSFRFRTWFPSKSFFLFLRREKEKKLCVILMMEEVRNRHTDIKYSLPKSFLQMRDVFQ